MDIDTITGKTLEQWTRQQPVLKQIMAGDEVFWTNPRYNTYETAQSKISITGAHVKEAEERWRRFAPYIARVFPETLKSQGVIESPLISIPAMQQHLGGVLGKKIPGSLLLKCDNDLPISGSIKARGGIYEVLKHAEDLALTHGLITENDDYTTLDSRRCRDFFSRYSLAVGSTGNLGLSIGIMGTRLGFRVSVHMSRDAKTWKKKLLREKGVTLIEHPSDYSKAVEEGRKEAARNPAVHFIDDENSVDLFLGYAVAASRLKKQLEALKLSVNREHPLFVYLPCGVGGGPGGITFGLKQVFKDHVHSFFAEPTAYPSMLLGLMTGRHHHISVKDFGMDDRSDADGLAVGRPSGFVGKTLEEMISGVYTVQDKTLYKMLQHTFDIEKIPLEPSAAAGIPGPSKLCHTESGRHYLEKEGLAPYMLSASHVVWATGGGMVPEGVMKEYYKKGLNFTETS